MEQEWIDQCKNIFKTQVNSLLWLQQNPTQDTVNGIIEKLSIQSKISKRVLTKWWNENNPAKNEYRPLCIKCKKYLVEFNGGKPVSKSAKHYGLCTQCRKENK